jgi:GT2 family glycosyltransferase
MIRPQRGSRLQPISFLEMDVHLPASAPTISVAIVTYNRKEQVTRAIQSVLAQATADIEIVVVDNNSSDGTAEHIAASFPQVRLIRLPRNVGCPDGRNHLYANCHGEYIVNLDDDGWLSQGVFPPLRDIFSQDERIGVVALRQAYPDEQGEVQGRAMSANIQDVTLFMGGVSAFRRSMLDKTGAFPPDFFLFAEETYLSLRVLDAGYRIVSAPHIVMWHPKVGGSHRGSHTDYHLFRNNLLVVTRLYPLPMLLRYLPLKAGSLLFASLRRGSFTSYLRALINVAALLPGTLLRRRPVSAAVVRRQLAMARHWTIVSKEGRLTAASGAAPGAA